VILNIILIALAIYAIIMLLLYGITRLLRPAPTSVKFEDDKTWGAYLNGEPIGYYPSKRSAVAAVSEFKARAKDKLN
jgi:hypothetical protein